MGKKKRIIIFLGVLAIGVAVLLFFLLRGRAPADIISGSGTIEATEVDIGARISGRVLEILTDEGEWVEEGDLLVRLDAKDLKARREGAEALSVEAERNFSRAKSLFYSGGISKMDLDRAETTYLSAKAQLDTIEATLADTEMYAPITGVVLTKNIEVAELAFPGVPILTLGDLRRVWIIVYVDEPAVGLVNLGDEAIISVDSYPKREFEGKVTFISQEPEFTPKNVQTKNERTKLVYGVKIELANPDLALKPGMPADAEISFSGAR
jgi:HlyD family secretion protein